MSRVSVKKLAVFAMLVSVVTVLSCSSVQTAASSVHVDWAFIQAVGGLEVSDPVHTGDGAWSLPVRCNITGLTAVTKEPETVNSALVVKSVKSRIRGDAIQFWVVTCSVSERHGSVTTDAIGLEEISPGPYRVQYLNPDGTTINIRVIKIAPHNRSNHG